MSARDWFLKVKSVLPRVFLHYMEEDFKDWRIDCVVSPEDFKNRVKDYIVLNIGKSASDPLSVKVFAIMEDKSEEEIIQEFSKKGLF